MFLREFLTFSTEISLYKKIDVGHVVKHCVPARIMLANLNDLKIAISVCTSCNSWSLSFVSLVTLSSNAVLLFRVYSG